MWRKRLLSSNINLTFHNFIHSPRFPSFHSTCQIRNKLHVAIIGSGPAGCYTAKYLLQHFDKLQQTDTSRSVDITILDRLPTPFGLIRSGIAPDHPEVKNVQNEFTALFHKYTPQPNQGGSQKPSLDFRGNITVGEPDDGVSWRELQSLFHIIVFAYGCADADVTLFQSSLQGIFSAREFVAWYNGHPIYASDMTRKLQQIFASTTGRERKHVVIIGQGNVALDCARILAKGTQVDPSYDRFLSSQKNTLRDTDITNQALDLLSNTYIQSIHILGRRGHVQGAFTIKELRELITLRDEGYTDVDVVVHTEELNLGMTPASIHELKESKPKTRIDTLLREHARTVSVQPNHDEHSSKMIIELRFLFNPIQFIPNPRDTTKIGSVLCQRTQLEGPVGKQVAVGKDHDVVEIPADVVLVSIGYRGQALFGMDDSMFDFKKGIILNQLGRVVLSDGSIQHGLYVAGWIKRGPTGIIGTNIPDAKETVSSILHDVDGDNTWVKETVQGREGLDQLLRQRLHRFVDFSAYLKIDQKERDPSRLRTEVQPREKLVSIEEMLFTIEREM